MGKTTIEYDDGKVRIEVTDEVAVFLEKDRKRQQAQDVATGGTLVKGILKGTVLNHSGRLPSEMTHF